MRKLKKIGKIIEWCKNGLCPLCGSDLGSGEFCSICEKFFDTHESDYELAVIKAIQDVLES